MVFLFCFEDSFALVILIDVFFSLQLPNIALKDFPNATTDIDKKGDPEKLVSTKLSLNCMESWQ